MLQYLVLVGAIVLLTGSSFYIKETISGRTKPNRMTWFLWSLAPMIGAVAAFSNGVTWAALPVFFAGFIPLLIFIASFVNKQSYWRLGIFDYFCGFFSLLALVLWAITKEPVVAIIFAIISDAFAAIPTVKKAWQHPETETAAPFMAAIFNTSTAFFAIRSWSFSAYAFPFYLICLEILMVIAIVRPRIKFGKSL